MKATIDASGRIVLPKQYRQRLGLEAGSELDISLYGDGLHVAPCGRTARLERHEGVLVATSDTEVTDDQLFDLIDAIRR